MPEADSIPIVFESGVVRFDADGHLHVHLTHGPGRPHPMVLHEVEGTYTIPGEADAVDLRGSEGGSSWHAMAQLPEVDDLPEGFVFHFQRWELAKVEMSGDLTVVLRGVEQLPGWMRAGHVHRFDGPDDGVRIWRGSEPPPRPAPPLEEPWNPERTGRWVGGAQTARPAGCSAAVLLLGAGLFGAGLFGLRLALG